MVFGHTQRPEVSHVQENATISSLQNGGGDLSTEGVFVRCGRGIRYAADGVMRWRQAIRLCCRFDNQDATFCLGQSGFQVFRKSGRLGVIAGYQINSGDLEKNQHGVDRGASRAASPDDETRLAAALCRLLQECVADTGGAVDTLLSVNLYQTVAALDGCTYSVFIPISLPSESTLMVFTAPIVRACSSIASKCSIIATLCGIVTAPPAKSGPAMMLTMSSTLGVSPREHRHELPRF